VPTLQWLRVWADLLDTRFRVPGTHIRFGLDPILSLVPGLGELVSPAFAIALLVQGLYQGVPRVILVRMVMNAFVDALVGAVPVAGTVADVFWKANRDNLTLLERYAKPGARPSRGDYTFVYIVAALTGLVMLIPVALALWLTTLLWQWAS
jgi:ABC-type antimicrobial peptide transport system permease subunit